MSVRRSKPVILGIVSLGLALTSFSCWDGKFKIPWQTTELDQLDRLALKLSTKFKRSLDQNDFSLFYAPEKPNVIVLEVRYRRKMDQDVLSKIIAAAEDNAKGVARDQFHIIINTRVDLQELPGDQ